MLLKKANRKNYRAGIAKARMLGKCLGRRSWMPWDKKLGNLGVIAEQTKTYNSIIMELNDPIR